MVKAAIVQPCNGTNDGCRERLVGQLSRQFVRTPTAPAPTTSATRSKSTFSVSDAGIHCGHHQLRSANQPQTLRETYCLKLVEASGTQAAQDRRHGPSSNSEVTAATNLLFASRGDPKGEHGAKREPTPSSALLRTRVAATSRFRQCLIALSRGGGTSAPAGRRRRRRAARARSRPATRGPHR